MPVKQYNRSLAVTYAHQWAYSRNPRYYSFDKLGGDCTNFASQCIYAGSGVMNYTPTFGWYYTDANRRAPAWSGVEQLYSFLTRQHSIGPLATELPLDFAQPGDIIQLRFQGAVFRHCPVVVQVGSPARADNILLAAHTMDADYRPLSTYSFSEARLIHITGVGMG